MIFVRLAIGRSCLGFKAYRVCPVSRSTRIAEPARISGGSTPGAGVRRTEGKGEGEVPPPGTGTGVGGGGSSVWARVGGVIKPTPATRATAQSETRSDTTARVRSERARPTGDLSRRGAA